MTAKETNTAAHGVGDAEIAKLMADLSRRVGYARSTVIPANGFHLLNSEAEAIQRWYTAALAAQPAPVEEKLPASVYKHPTLGGLLCNATGVPEWLHNCGCPIHAEQPAPVVGGAPFGDERWVAVKPEGAPYYGIHTESGATIAGTASGLSEQDAKHICGLHNNELCEADDLIRNLGFDPSRFRTEGGRINYYRLGAAIRFPEDYEGLALAARPGGEGDGSATGEEATVDRAIYDYLCAADNQDVPLEKWPTRIVKALAMVGYAIVPCELPFEVLGEAQRCGVFETGNPKHGWDYLIGKTRVYLIAPNSAHPAQAGGGRDGN